MTGPGASVMASLVGLAASKVTLLRRNTSGNKGSGDNEHVKAGYIRKGEPTPVSPDFENLKSKWATIKPTGVKKADYDANHVSTRNCPTSTQGGWWQVDGNVRLPALGETHTGDFTKIPSATADPGKNDGKDDKNDSSDDKENGSSILDNRLTAAGSIFFATVLGLALWL